MWCGTVWCGIMFCVMVRNAALQCEVVQYGAAWRIIVQYCTALHDMKYYMKWRICIETNQVMRGEMSRDGVEVKVSYNSHHVGHNNDIS